MNLSFLTRWFSSPPPKPMAAWKSPAVVTLAKVTSACGLSVEEFAHGMGHGSKSVRPATIAQQGIQAQAVRMLIKRKSITAWDILMLGTTDCHKMLSRMRKMGLLYDADDPSGHKLIKNASGHGTHRRHFWTGKIPDGWEKPCKTKLTKDRL